MRAQWILLSACALLWAASHAAADDGQDLYLANCASCHGIYGEGDGPAAPGLVMQDLRYINARSAGRFPSELIRQLIDGRETRATHGPEGMPVWGDAFALYTDAEGAARKIDAVVGYLETMQLNE